MNRFVLIIICFILWHTISAQQHARLYIPPTDSLVQKNLAEWQDLKFGLLMHWGTYSQWGIVESWSLCPEDEGWCTRRGDHADNWSFVIYPQEKKS